MTTNGEWLEYLANNAPDELAAWFDAEHVETEERALDGDTEPENEDSRERLEADISKYLNYPNDCRAVYDYNAVIGWLDRQAAITAEETSNAWEEYRDATQREIAELTAERDELKRMVDGQREVVRRYQDSDCGKLTAERDNLAADLMRANNERERYREKFGKCLDYADAIHALMDDEGMA